MILKANKQEYEITKNDRFLNNGKKVELITQSKEPMQGGRRPNPVLSHWEVKRLYNVGVVEESSRQYDGVEIRVK